MVSPSISINEFRSTAASISHTSIRPKSGRGRGVVQSEQLGIIIADSQKKKKEGGENEGGTEARPKIEEQ